MAGGPSLVGVGPVTVERGVCAGLVLAQFWKPGAESGTVLKPQAPSWLTADKALRVPGAKAR